MASALDNPPAQPRRVLGRYALFHELGHGGTATVHLGRLVGPVGFSKLVAVKMLHAKLGRDTELTATLLDEARLVSRVRHPNVVSMLDVLAAQGEVSLIMEYVHGVSLAALRRAVSARGERVPANIAVHIVRDVLYGLHAAHEATTERGIQLGLVHRDVSPQNILIGVDGSARILDFGIAKAIGRYQDTHTGQLKGKPSYMAPEQVMGQAIDRRVDVFAVGVVLWETLAGRKLFEAQSSVEAMYRVLEAEIPSLNSMDGIPETVVRAVARALKRDPRERFQTALEFACELEASSLLPTRMVGEWVRQCCAAELAEREEQLRAVEAAELDGFTQEPNSGPYEVVSAGSFPAGSDDPTELEANLALGRPSEPSVLPRHASAKRAERALPAGRRIVVFFSLFVAVIVIGLVSQRWPTRGAGESAPASLVSAESPTSLEPAVSAPADRDAREAPSVDPFDPHAARSSATPESTRPQTHAAPETRAPTSKPAGAKTNPERPAARKPSRKSAGVTERRPEDLFSRQ